MAREEHTSDRVLLSRPPVRRVPLPGGVRPTQLTGQHTQDMMILV